MVDERLANQSESNEALVLFLFVAHALLKDSFDSGLFDLLHGHLYHEAHATGICFFVTAGEIPETVGT